MPDDIRKNQEPAATDCAPVAETVEPTTDSLRLHTVTGTYREILRLTGPLVLSSTGFMLMHIVDAVFLARCSKQAIAVVGPASMAGFMALSLFMGVAGYTSTFVAQYVGARRPERVGAAVWQGLYFAFAAGVVLALAGSSLAGPLFRWVRHAPEIQGLEAEYFMIMCWSAPFALVGSALSGFFSGRGDNVALMAAQLAGFVVNGFLSYGLIFGVWGLPEMRSSGAAAATALAQLLIALILAVLFFSPKHRERFQTWRRRALDLELLRRMLYFGAFNGLRFLAEILAWAIFLFYVGRLGETEIAITNIVWRLNGFAFFPLIGLSMAIATLVGHAQGSGEPGKSERVTWRGVLISEAWMLFAVAIFLLFPRPLLNIFHNPETMSAAEFDAMAGIGVILLRYVALYCLLDGLNIIFIGALQGAGDTRWTLCASFGLHLIFLASLAIMDYRHMALYAFWGAATAFVMLQALVWMARFMTGKWKAMRVIEGAEPVPAARV